jgi:cation diffusion facilitator CzcD-associated flavoprotein CzcO
MSDHRDPTRRSLRFVVIGAGMAGILSAIKLKEAGFEDVVIYEKADRLGGTWRENTYPGIACDVPAHFYSYSFALNPEWSRRYAPGAEIQAYFERVAHRYGVDTLIRYGKEIVTCERASGRWKLQAKDGSHDEADFVIAATGVLHHPAYPDIEGLDSFAGPRFHSARWDHGVPLAGKRVGVIGTGSSAVQIVSALIDQVKQLSLFQRTPQWITPIENTPFSEEEKARFREDPDAIMAIRSEVSTMYIDGFSNHLSDMNSPQLQMIHEFCKAHLESSVKDPELREKLRPDYRAGCKRLVLSGAFYDAIQRPNAKLVAETIERIEKGGVRTRDGKLHELDVLVLATGFRVDRFLRPITVMGRNQTSLETAWRDGPAAYLAISVPDFPNLFLLNGPSAPVGNFSLIEVVELQFAYILKLIEQVRAGRCQEISASRAAMARFETDRKQTAKNTIWASGCKSWYLDAEALPTAWPWTYDRFREEMREPRLADYEMK